MKKILIAAALLAEGAAFAANPPPPGLPDDPVNFPIDSCLPILFAAGTLFGIYTISKKK